MTIEEFVRNFEVAIEGIEPNSLNATTDFKALDLWDSLAALSILAMIDTEYSLQVSGNELKNSKTIADLFGVLSTKKSA